MSDQKPPQDGEKKLKTIKLSDIRPRQSIERDRVRQTFAHGKSKTVEVEVRRRARRSIQGSDQEESLNSSSSKNDEFETRLRAVREAMRTQKEEEPAEVVQPLEADDNAGDNVETTQDSAPLKQEDLSEDKEGDSKPSAPLPEEKKIIEVSSSSEKNAAPLRKVTVGRRTATKRKSFDDITPIVLKANEYQRSKPTPDTGRDANRKTDASHKPRLKEKEAIPLDIDQPNPDKQIRPLKTDYKKNRGDNDEENRFKRNRNEARKLSQREIHHALDENYDGDGLRKRRSKRAKTAEEVAEVRAARDVTIFDTMTLADLANRMAVRSAELVKILMKMGRLVTVNEPIDIDTAELLCVEMGFNYKRVADSDVEEGLTGEVDQEDQMLPRPPIVTVMGHVDHGKTSLLDALRQADVVSKEAGGITQHIGAYQVTLKEGKRKGQKITFIDTPGHAAFSAMRARGANITDVVVLVVAADDGIKDQTVEAIRHAQAANVPIVVAVNKVDKPDAQPERVKTELMQHGLIVESFGGDILSVDVSAKQKTGLAELEEGILLQAEIMELKANPDRSAEGVVIEAKMDKGRGALVTALISRGTLKTGDIVVAGTEWGRVRALFDDHGGKCSKAIPAMPVEIVGFGGVPSAGDDLVVVDHESRAREITEYRSQRQRLARAASMSSMEKVMSQMAESASDKKELPILIKGDVQGSVEAIAAGLAKIQTDEVSVRVLHSAVGGINESDVTLAKASSALILAFNVRPNAQARDLAKQESIEIRTYSVIYDLFEDIKAVLGGLLAPTLREKELGRVEIREVFNVSKVGRIAGCYVLDGIVKRGSKIRLLRDNVVIYTGDLKTLKRFKDDVKEVKESFECGLSIEGYNDIQVGDIVECFEMEEIARKL